MNKYYLKAKKINPVLFEERKEIELNKTLKQGEDILIDTEKHFVGHVSISLSSKGHHQDSPIYLQINFFEHRSETNMDFDSYHGWISKAWIQEEKIHVDVTPTVLQLERRYAFRYIRIKVLFASNNFDTIIDKLSIISTSSADYTNVESTNLKGIDKKIDEVSLATLHDCMQEVFEDGPKRDRRLWLGDLRLQAMTNYLSFKNNDLVKKCLYLFAGSIMENGLVSSNVFLKPEIEKDFQALMDYSMIFIPTVLEYYRETDDMELLKELEPICVSQFGSMHKVLEKGMIKEDCFPFIDWNLNLKKSVSMVGVYLYSLGYLKEMEEILQKDTKDIEKEIRTYKEKALGYFNESKGLFEDEGQVSYCTQVWMILGDVVSKEEGIKLIDRLKTSNALKMVSPYMNHYYLEALLKLGLMDELKAHIEYYWGGMIEDGADTFYEIFNPENPDESPYGGKIVHSFCHAWSCTPSYFLRKYFNK